jgi:hypothetical protein
MTRSTLKRPSPGTALGFLALVVALAGNANAFSSTHLVVRRGDIAKGAVTAGALAKAAVHAKALANGAVTTRAIKQGAVTANTIAANAVGAPAIAKGAVGPNALAPDAVTASALAPNSVYGGALGPVSVHSTPIADLDETVAAGSWTTSNTEDANCASGERLLTGGVIFTNPGNREVAIVRSLPFSNPTLNGVSGQITSNSGGTASAEVVAICLK